MTAFQQATPPGTGWNPATTAWQPAQVTLPAALSQPAAATATSPALLLHQVVPHLGFLEQLGTEVWEQTMRIGPEEVDRVVGVVLYWGLMDDAVAGEDFRVRMRRSGAAWYVEQIERRAHCARNISPGGLCS